MLRARKLGVLTPCVLSVEHEASTIYLERIDGMSVKQALAGGTLEPAGKCPAKRRANIGAYEHLRPLCRSGRLMFF